MFPTAVCCNDDFGQGDRKSRTFAELTFNADGAAVRFDDGLHDREPEAERAFGVPMRTGAGIVGTIKTAKDFGKVFLRNSYSGIGNAKTRLMVRAIEEDKDFTAGRSVFERVIEQVHHHLIKPRGIDRYAQIAGRLIEAAFEPQAALFGQYLAVFTERLQIMIQVDGLAVEREPPVVRAREHEEAFDDPLHALDLFHHARKDLPRLFGSERVGRI